MARRPESSITAAIRRLRTEPQFPLSHLDGLDVDLGAEGVLRVRSRTLLRWGQEGRRGVYLDILFDRRACCWVTSRDALERFRRAVDASTRPAV